MPVNDEQIITRLQELLGTVDLETTSERKLREILEAEFKEDLKDRKAIIRQEIQSYLEKQQEGAEDDEDEVKEDDDDEPSQPAAKKKSKGNGRGMSHFGSALSADLQEFLGVESMPRTQVVRAIWDYIKEHNLQDPKNKRKICCDDKLAKILGPRTDMFKMNKALSKHVYTPDHHDEETEEEAQPPPKKAAAKKPAARDAPAKKAAASAKAKRKPAAEEENGADEDDDEAADVDEDQDGKPKKKRKRATDATGGGSALSPEMQEFLGVERMARTQVVKALWAYIKENNLQDPNDRRNILPDAKLGKVLQAPVNQFSLQKQLSKHILKSA